MSEANSRREALRRIDARSQSIDRPAVANTAGDVFDEVGINLIAELRRITGPNQAVPIVWRENLEELLESNLLACRRCSLTETPRNRQRPPCVVQALDSDHLFILKQGPWGVRIYDPRMRAWRSVRRDSLPHLMEPQVLEVSPLFPLHGLKLRDLVGFTFQCIRSDLLWALICSIGIVLLMLTAPLLTKRVVQDVVPSGDLFYIASAAVISILIAFYHSLFQWIQGFFLTRLSSGLAYQSSLALYNRVMQLPVAFSERYSVGDLTSRASSFSSVLDSLSSSSLSTLVSSLSLIGYGVLMINFDRQLAIFALFLVLVCTGLQLLFSLRLIRYKARAAELGADLYDATIQTLGLATQVRSTATEPFFLDRWTRSKMHATTNSFQAATFSDWMSSLASSVSSLGYVLFYAVVIVRLLRAESLDILSETTGIFIVFTSAFAGFAGQAQALSDLLSGTAASVVVDFNRAKLLLSQPAETALAFDKKHHQLVGAIEFCRVGFRYPETQTPVFEDLSFQLKPGQFNVIFGPSGCGKSTVLSLILGFYQPHNGSILIDNHELVDLNIKQLRAQIGTVLQAPALPPGSIAEAVSGGLSLPADQVWSALEQANVAEEIDALPMKLETVLSEGASNISGGQRQRICIARALAHEPRLLLEDEATSALDTTSQGRIAGNLRARSITRVVIAHRLSAIKGCDHMVVIHKGRVEAEGSYAHCCGASPYLQAVLKSAGQAST